MTARALMLQGTGSDVGKSVLVAGLCRAFANRGLTVRPFKPQNMSNNAAVAREGGEIGRAQWLQAVAARVAPSIHMNPVLLKPESDTGAQIIVQGQVWGRAEAISYQAQKPQLMAAVMDSFDRLKAECDLVLVEGAGSPAEVNLRTNDIANMGFALPSQTPVVLVGDINRGGVIAAITGTHGLLPEAERDLIKGYIINIFRGDVRLFDGGLTAITEATGWPCFGIVPFLRCVKDLPAEDAVVLEQPAPARVGKIRVAVPLIPRIANFDDLDPLRGEADIDLVICPPGTPLPMDADLIILPGSKATIADLRFLKSEGWHHDIMAHARAGRAVLGLCGGYQMLGTLISDPDGAEGPAGDAESGLGLLQVATLLKPGKTVRTAKAWAPEFAAAVSGYEIHTGETTGPDCERPFLVGDGQPLGASAAARPVWGTYLHGLFDAGVFRASFLKQFNDTARPTADFSARVDASLEALAAALEKHLDLDALYAASR